MNDMVENGSSGGGPSLPPGDPHDEFLELCALTTTDWLSAEDKKRLDQHLAHCSLCQDALRQYQVLVDTGVPAAAVAATEGRWDADSNPSLSEAEAALFARLDPEEAHRGCPAREPASAAHFSAHPDSGSSDALWRHMWWQYAAGLILALALGYSVYRTGIRRGTEMAQAVAPPATGSQLAHGPALAAAAPPTATVGDAERETAALQTRDGQLATLGARLRQQSAQVAQLDAEKRELEQKLTSADADHVTLAQARDDLARQLDTTQAQLQAARQRQEASATQNSVDEVRVAALSRQIEQLSASIGQKDQELAREQALLDHDQDVRELMGSRNLYIAEVYDVAKNGDTQRPFGRVFYTRGKSLVFYAYDLDQQPGLREASSFQAWGRRGPDQAHAVNLGVFYADSAQKKRWVVKDDDPKTLAEIDAVFVTVEPHGGSSHPSGKPLLFAYLRIEPNHP
jgi:hypothetical protein